MSEIRINSIKIKNYRSFGKEQQFCFPTKEHKKPIAIVGPNNCGKTNLINAILYGISYKYCAENCFTKYDLHNLDYNNLLYIETSLTASPYKVKNKNGGTDEKSIMNGSHSLEVEYEDNELRTSMKPYSLYGAAKHYNIFFINFHCIKDEISTQKTSWGNLKSFLGKHIQKIVSHDKKMHEKKNKFQNATNKAVNDVIEGSDLQKFIEKINTNYKYNLRENDCLIDFGFPDYEEIFQQMMFKVGLNCHDVKELVPIDHFGDGYISMFVMAVIQAIAETNTDDKCLFLFEEPESFLHEHHQEYFYKMVLCNLAEKGHQVIYTTHSDRMVDIWDTKSIIRIEFDENSKQTLVKFNETGEFNPEKGKPYNSVTELVSLENFNSFLKSVEPNLNKILFSRKVVLVEGPNDLMAYKYAVEKKVFEVKLDKRFSEAYLSLNNIAIIPHHGKTTALYLIGLCKWLRLDYFIITDWDFDEDFVTELSGFSSLEELKESLLYNTSPGKAKLTVNWNLINAAKKDQIHFNIRKLECVIGYKGDDKNSLNIWNTLMQLKEFPTSFFPGQLEDFIELNRLETFFSLQEESLSESFELPSFLLQ
jgi:putative ATP-dependent endonuclease of the OLD family